MEQLRKRFYSGLDISELLADDHETTEEEEAEVCCSYSVHVLSSYYHINQMRLQHDGREQTLVSV